MRNTNLRRNMRWEEKVRDGKKWKMVGWNNVRLLPVIYLNLIAGDVAVQRLSASSLSRMQLPSKIMIPVRIYMLQYW